jgi:hypothetical protein
MKLIFGMQPYFDLTRKTTSKKNGKRPQKPPKNGRRPQKKMKDDLIFLFKQE